MVAVAATNRTNGKLTSDTVTMGELVKNLNDPKVSNVVKEDFIALLEIDKSRINTIAQFKFEPSDFDALITKQAKLSPVPQKSTKVQKGNVAKEILKQERPKSMQAKITQEAQSVPIKQR